MTDEDIQGRVPRLEAASLLPRRAHSLTERLFDGTAPGPRPRARARRGSRRTVVGTTPKANAPRSQPTWLYLLTHVHRTRFKVGYSACLPDRLARLGAEQFDPTACWGIRLPDRKAAEDVERSLHRFLSPYRLRDLVPADGYTEWFAIGAIALALDLMRSVPVRLSPPGEPVRFLPLRQLRLDTASGDPNRRAIDVDVTITSPGWVPSAWMDGAPAEIQVQHRVGEIAALVEVMATWWPLQWHPVADPNERTASAVSAARAWRLGLAGDLLVVKGLRAGPSIAVDEVDYHALRRRVLEPLTWELLPGKPESSLVATMDYGSVGREDLLLRMRPRAVLRCWPGAAAALPMLWQTIGQAAGQTPTHAARSASLQPTPVLQGRARVVRRPVP